MTYIQTELLTDEQLTSIISEPKNRLRDSPLLVQLIRSYQELRWENEEVSSLKQADIRRQINEAQTSLRSDLMELCAKHRIIGGPGVDE